MREGLRGLFEPPPAGGASPEGPTPRPTGIAASDTSFLAAGARPAIVTPAGAKSIEDVVCNREHGAHQFCAVL